MKQVLLTVILTAGMLSGYNEISAQRSVPYSSDLGINFGIDPDWTSVNKGNSKAKRFEYDRDADCSTPGTSGAVAHKYDSSYAADCWIVSPSISLRAGTLYTVSVWTKTRGNVETEKFEICVATSPEVTDLKSGTTLMRNENYQHASDFEKQIMTFTPSSSGNYHFGIHCFSDADMYDFSVTGFSITGDDGGQTVDPEKKIKELPYEFDFTDAEAFASDWISAAGPQAEVTSPWGYNSFISVAEFDAQGKREDNWLLSPAIYFPEAGTYMLSATCTIYGTMDFAIGNNKDDLTSFQLLHTVADGTLFEEEYAIGFSVSEPGTYHIGYHAKAETGTSMGYRVHYMKVKADKPVPASVTDLKVVPDSNDGLSVELLWTNPDVDQNGNPIGELTKVEIYRNGIVCKEFESPVSGASETFVDLVPQSGVYTYYVLAYNSNGAIDSEPLSVSAGFVGHPTASFPFDLSTSSASDEDLVKFTILDANADSYTWKLVEGYYNSRDFQSTQNGKDEANDWLATPYLTLAKGYYRMEVRADARFNSYEVGYASSRHDLPGTYVKCYEVNNEQDYSYQLRSAVIPIPADGEYVLVVRHVGQTASTAYPTMKVNYIALSEQALLPGVATGVKVSEIEDALTHQACVEWTNPSIDNAGQPLDPTTSLSIVILRDGKEVVTLSASSEHTPGKAESYIDTSITEGGEYTYTVEVSNVNGHSEEVAPSASCYIGPALPLPYSTTDFTAWNLINDGNNWYEWEVDETTKSATWSKLWGDPENDCLLSPFVRIENDALYEVTVEAMAPNGDMDWGLMVGSASRFDALSKLATVTTQECDVPIVHSFELLSSNSARELSQDPGASSEISIESGKKTIGIVPSKTGKLTISAFKIEKKTTTGLETVYASAGAVRFQDGIISFSEDTKEVRIYSVGGTILYSQIGSHSIDASALPSGVAVVIAITPEGSMGIKLNIP